MSQQDSTSSLSATKLLYSGAIPKPDYKKERRARKAEKKRKDRALQSRGNERSTFSQETEYKTCPACHAVMEIAYMTRHHIKRKLTEEDRYNEEWLADLCYNCHSELHIIGDIDFAEKHEKNLKSLAPDIFEKLIHRNAPSSCS